MSPFPRIFGPGELETQISHFLLVGAVRHKTQNLLVAMFSTKWGKPVSAKKEKSEANTQGRADGMSLNVV